MQPPMAPSAHSSRPALKEIVAEAARALARLDAARLEELALSCQALNRDLNRPAGSDLPPIRGEQRAQLAAEARAARRDMATFARVLEATRANVQVIERLRALRSGSLEYTVGPKGDCDARWPSPENSRAESRQEETTRGND
jgi:hypothetical protein